MKRFLIVAVLMVACSQPSAPRAASPSPSPSPAVITASAYWDQHPSDLHNLCVELKFFAEFIGGLNETAYRTSRKSWTERDYHPGPTDPPSVDVFAEAVSRCGL